MTGAWSLVAGCRSSFAGDALDQGKPGREAYGLQVVALDDRLTGRLPQGDEAARLGQRGDHGLRDASDVEDINGPR